MILREASRRGIGTMIALISMKNKAGKKPLQVAEEAGGRGGQGVVEMLASAIAPPPPRLTSHFLAITKLANFFEEAGAVPYCTAESHFACTTPLVAVSWSLGLTGGGVMSLSGPEFAAGVDPDDRRCRRQGVSRCALPK
jgi:hypothetical protein